MAAERWRARLLTLSLLALLVFAASPGRACVGDRNGDARVTVDEVIRCVGCFLAPVPFPGCSGCVSGSDGPIAINVLVQIVNNALVGCPAAPAATPTPTVSPSLTLTHAPSLTPTATPTRSPTSWTPTSTRTVTSCVSEAPDIYTALPDGDDPFLWHFSGRSRVLLWSRGTVGASLNCSERLAVIRFSGEQAFEIDAALVHPGTNLVRVCTAPGCGTAYCAQRRIDCAASTCVDLGNLPPIPARDVCPTPTPPPGVDLRPGGVTAFGVYSNVCRRPLAYLSVCVENAGASAAGPFVVAVEPGNDRFEIAALDAQARLCADRPFTGWEQSAYHSFTVEVDVENAVDELDETNNAAVTEVLRPNIPLTCSPTASPTSARTPTPTGHSAVGPYQTHG